MTKPTHKLYSIKDRPRDLSFNLGRWKDGSLPPNDWKTRTAMSSRHKGAGQQWNSQRQWPCAQYLHRFKPETIPALSSRSSTPNQEAISNWQLLGDGRLVFLSRMALDASTRHQGRPQASLRFGRCWPTQNGLMSEYMW